MGWQYSLFSGLIERVSGFNTSPRSLEQLNIVHVAIPILKNEVEKKPISPNYKGLCIFHSERTPSFYIRPLKNDYRCFGCGAHGGPLMFLERVVRNPLEYLEINHYFKPSENDFENFLLEEIKFFRSVW